MLHAESAAATSEDTDDVICYVTNDEEVITEDEKPHVVCTDEPEDVRLSLLRNFLAYDPRHNVSTSLTTSFINVVFRSVHSMPGTTESTLKPCGKLMARLKVRRSALQENLTRATQNGNATDQFIFVRLKMTSHGSFEMLRLDVRERQCRVNSMGWVE